MFDNLQILSLSGDLARHATVRQSLVAGNIANANTPGYRPQDLSAFEPRQSDFANALRQTRPGHLGAADGTPSDVREMLDSPKPNGNAVSLEREMVKAVEIRNRHQMALTVYGTAMDVLRSSLGRR